MRKRKIWEKCAFAKTLPVTTVALDSPLIANAAVDQWRAFIFYFKFFKEFLLAAHFLNEILPRGGTKDLGLLER